MMPDAPDKSPRGDTSRDARAPGPEAASKQTYASYLRLSELLSIQSPKSSPVEHDEVLFIIVHQVYELWFKLLLHEFEKVRRDLSANHLSGAIGTFKRVRMVLKVLVSQLDVLETMTPMNFLAFRDRLEESSGFQSYQFRELEFLLGHKREEMLRHHPEGSAERAALERRLRERSVVDCFYDFLEHHGVAVPREIRERDPAAPTQPNEAVQEGLLHLYRAQPDVAILLEMMVDIDEGLQEWRYHHVKMVERTIGNKRGTGGSPGVEFLKKTLFQPLFPDLWAIRHRL
jgi:tryptophan 2,3-dioxygenase